MIESRHSPVNNHNNTTTLNSSIGCDDTQYYHLSQPNSSSASSSSCYATSRSCSLMDRNRSICMTKKAKKRRKSLPNSKLTNNFAKTNNISEDPFSSVQNNNSRTIPEVFLTRLLMWYGCLILKFKKNYKNNLAKELFNVLLNFFSMLLCLLKMMELLFRIMYL